MQAWQSAAQLLQLHLQGQEKQPPALAFPTAKAKASIDQISKARTSRAEMEQMLQAEVPRQVITACCKVLQHSSSTSASTAAAPAYPHLSVQESLAGAWRAYCLLLPSVLLSVMVQLDYTSAAQATPPAHYVLMGQRFQQSGFLDLLPQLLRDTADQLQAAAAAADTVSSSQSINTGSVASSSNPRGTRQQNTPLPKLSRSDWGPGRPDLLLLEDACHLLLTYSMLALCWPPGKFVSELVPACAPAVVRLASISFQRVSELVERYEMDASAHSAVLDLWSRADAAAQLALTPDDGARCKEPRSPESSRSFIHSSGMQQYLGVLFDAPLTAQCMAVVLTSAVYTALLLQLPNLPDLSSGSSSGSGCDSRSSSSGGSSSNRSKGGDSAKRKPARKLRALQCLDPGKAWQFACEQHQLLPPTHQELLRHAGCSSRTVLFAAAQTAAHAKASSPPAAQHFIGTVCVNRLHILLSMFNVYVMRCQQMSDEQQQQQQHNISQEQQQQQLLLCLMPGVLLYWAALQPPTVPPGVVIDVWPAASFSTGAIDAAMQLAGHSSKTLLMLQSMWAFSSHRTLRPFIPAAVREMLLGDILTLATCTGARYLASLGGTERSVSTIGTSSSGSTSSSSSRAPAVTRASCEHEHVGTGWTNPAKGHELAQDLIYLLARLSEDTDFAAAAAGVASNAEAAQPDSPSAAVWQKHTLAVTQLLEGTVRHCRVGSALLCLIGDIGPGPVAAGSRAAGPDSPEQQQFISLLCSTLKALTAPALQEGPLLRQAELQVSKCLTTLAAATASLCDALSQHSKTSGAVGAAEHKAALAAVPWLAIMGRCLLLLAALLPAVCTPPAQGQAKLFVPSAAPGAQLGGSGSQNVGLSLLLRGVLSVARKLQGFASDDGPTRLTAQLTAAGFSSWEVVPAQLQLLAPSHSQVSTAAEHMTALGLSLSSLAFPTACNNPRCSNLSGPSELLLVSGRGNMCGGCRVARYCSRGCQRQHWKQHKPVCQALAAAAKTATADSAPAAATVDTAAAAAAAPATAPAAANQSKRNSGTT